MDLEMSELYFKLMEEPEEMENQEQRELFAQMYFISELLENSTLFNLSENDMLVLCKLVQTLLMNANNLSKSLLLMIHN